MVGNSGIIVKEDGYGVFVFDFIVVIVLDGMNFVKDNGVFSF